MREILPGREELSPKPWQAVIEKVRVTTGARVIEVILAIQP
jgi:hypothetical protein